MHSVHGKKFDLNLLLAFDALIRERNVTKAAEQLGISQSAMSHALRRLRDFYSDPLFVRVGDVMKPTAYAESISSTVVDVISAINGQLMTQASFDPKTAERVFCLCMTDICEFIFLPKIINRLLDVAPFCRIKTIQMSVDNLSAILESGEADLALGSHYVTDPELFQQELYMQSAVCIVSANNKEVKKTITLEKFSSMGHISVMLSDKCSRYDTVYDDMDLQRDIRLTTPHFLLVPMILEQSPYLIATVPKELGQVFNRYNAVKMLPPPIEFPKIPMRQYWHPRHHHDAANIWFRQLIKSLFINYKN
jgi:DNA-binding transcriptional LysR family regulator